MAQLESTGALSVPADQPRSAEAAGSDLRTWLSRGAILAALLAGFLLANTLPAVMLADGSGVPLSEVAAKLTKAGDGWVMVLAWLTGIIAALSAVVFPRSERFVQTLAVAFASLLALILPVFVSRSLPKVDPEAVALGPGLQGYAAAFVVAALLPWGALLVWNRAEPVLGRDWGKWLFVLPAIVWILMLTVFPLAYAISTSRYAFRNGKIIRDVGWGNYRKLFNDTLFSWSTALPVILTVVGIVLASLALVALLGGARAVLSGEPYTGERLRGALRNTPLLAVPVVLYYLTLKVLDKDVSFILAITYFFLVGAVFFEMILGFGLALLFNREIRGRSVMRTILTLPIFATPVAIGYLGRTIFYEGGGPVNSLLSTFGITPPPWLSDPFWSRITTIIADVWQWTPFVFIIALAGLQGLPQDILEASEVDGATVWDNFRHITLPLMAPILWLILLLRAIDAFKVFDLVVAMTLGGPGQATRYYSYFNYQTARKFFFYGEAAAQAFLLLFIVVVLVALLWGKIAHIYEDEEGVRA